MKKHRFKSIDGAVRRIRELEKIVAAYKKIASRLTAQTELLAMAAADGPAFDNPILASETKRVRDEILQRIGLAPDGTRLSK